MELFLCGAIAGVLVGFLAGLWISWTAYDDDNESHWS